MCKQYVMAQAAYHPAYILDVCRCAAVPACQVLRYIQGTRSHVACIRLSGSFGIKHQLLTSL